MKPSETLESRHSREWCFFSKFFKRRTELRVDAFLAPLREGSQVCHFSRERHMERYSLT